MSSRNMRKLLGGNVLPANPDDDSDYEPLSYQQIVNKFEAVSSMLYRFFVFLSICYQAISRCLNIEIVVLHK